MRELTELQKSALLEFQKYAEISLKEYRQPKKLLSKGNTNTKTEKNKIDTYILYLLPWKYNSKGINLCPNASEGCSMGCLVWAGRGVFNNVKKARLFRSEFYLRDRDLFMSQLAHEIIRIINRYKKQNKPVRFRLNGTSDIDFVYMLKKRNLLDIDTVANIAHFYDYTAILGKAIKYKDSINYSLALSRKEDNQCDILKAINLNINVSVVFRDELPEFYYGAPVIDGDKADDLMCENKGVVLGLRAKGKAKKDKSNFVLN